jgi:hypothetical protein
MSRSNLPNTGLQLGTDEKKHIKNFLKSGDPARRELNRNIMETSQEQDSQEQEQAFALYLKMFRINCYQTYKEVVNSEEGIPVQREYDHPEFRDWGWNPNVFPQPFEVGMMDESIDILTLGVRAFVTKPYFQQLQLSSSTPPFEWTANRFIQFMNLYRNKQSDWMTLLRNCCPIKLEYAPRRWITDSYRKRLAKVKWTNRVTIETVLGHESLIPIDGIGPFPFNECMLLPDPEDLVSLIIDVLVMAPKSFKYVFPFGEWNKKNMHGYDLFVGDTSTEGRYGDNNDYSGKHNFYLNVMPAFWMMKTSWGSYTQCGLLYKVFEEMERKFSLPQLIEMMQEFELDRAHVTLLMSTILSANSKALPAVFEAILTVCNNKVANSIARVFKTYMCGIGEMIPMELDTYIRSGKIDDVIRRYDVSKAKEYVWAVMSRSEYSCPVRRVSVMDVFRGDDSDYKVIDRIDLYLDVLCEFYTGQNGKNYGIPYFEKSPFWNASVKYSFDVNVIKQHDMSQYLKIMVNMKKNTAVVANLLGNVWGYCDCVYRGSMTKEFKSYLLNTALPIDAIGEGYSNGVANFEYIYNYVVQERYRVSVIELLKRAKAFPFDEKIAAVMKYIDQYRALKDLIGQYESRTITIETFHANVLKITNQ